MQRQSGIEELMKANRMFLTVDEMSEISGIGQNFLRSLIERREVDFLEIGAKKLLTRQAILEWYDRSKVRAVACR
jgi:excisionase family DNA binding protein